MNNNENIQGTYIEKIIYINNKPIKVTYESNCPSKEAILSFVKTLAHIEIENYEKNRKTT